MRRAAPHLAEIAERAADQSAIARRAESVAQDKFGRGLAAAQDQRRHRMEIEQQRRPPARAQLFQRLMEARMVGLMDIGDSRLEFVFMVPPVPQFAKPRQTARNQAQTAARAAAGGIAADAVGGARGEHVPINIIGRAIEIDHRPGCVGNQQRCSGGFGDSLSQAVDITVFQSQRGKAGVAHPLKQRAGIGPPGMRDRDQHRDGGGLRAG